MTTYNDNVLPTAYAAPLSGTFRARPEDFIVDEQMIAIEFSGEGEHLWLHIRKTNANTDWVAKQLARAAGIAAKDVGYAGLKDRHAITTQWFSLQLPGMADPDFSELPDDIEILDSQRHNKKLKRGALHGNCFALTLREVTGDVEQAQAICQQIAANGVPNYFGEQRFGHDGGNLTKAEAWFRGDFRPKQRHQRSLYLSSARSWLFNQILAKRVQDGTWNQYVAGDVFMFDGGHSWFTDDGDANLPERIASQAIHPTGAMWGRGRLESQGDVHALEQAVADECPVFCEGLERNGLKQERRALRINVQDLALTPLDDSSVRLTFALPAGAYATTVLAQLGQFNAPVHGSA